MDDLLKEMMDQYENTDSKKQETPPEKEVNMEEVMSLNELTKKWLEEEKEFIENSKNENHSKDAFRRKSSAEKTRETLRKMDEKEEKKDDRNKGSYGRYGGYGGYGSYSSKKDSDNRSSDEKFYDKVQKSFDNKIKEAIKSCVNESLNNIEEESCEWDIFDLQNELRRKRILKRDYEDKIQAEEFKKDIEKIKNRCSRKIDLAEVLISLKVNPHK